MKLARNKFNYCSQEYLGRLEEYFELHKNLLNRMEVGQIYESNFDVPNLEILDEDEVEEMTCIAKQLIANKERKS